MSEILSKDQRAQQKHTETAETIPETKEITTETKETTTETKEPKTETKETESTHKPRERKGKRSLHNRVNQYITSSRSAIRFTSGLIKSSTVPLITFQFDRRF